MYPPDHIAFFRVLDFSKGRKMKDTYSPLVIISDKNGCAAFVHIRFTISKENIVMVILRDKSHRFSVYRFPKAAAGYQTAAIYRLYIMIILLQRVHFSAVALGMRITHSICVSVSLRVLTAATPPCFMVASACSNVLKNTRTSRISGFARR